MASTSLTPMDRVRRIARWMRVLAVLGAVLLVAATVSMWSSPQWIARVTAGEVGVSVDPASITPALQWQGGLLTMLPVAVGLFALLQVWRLFGEYGRGAIFTSGATARLRRLAWSLVAISVVQVLTRTALSVLLTFDNPPGRRMLTLGLSSHDYALLLFGVLLLAIAWVMVEATRIARENDEFV